MSFRGRLPVEAVFAREPRASLYAASLGVVGREPTADDAGTVPNALIALFPVTPSAVPAWTLADDPEEG